MGRLNGPVPNGPAEAVNSSAVMRKSSGLGRPPNSSAPTPSDSDRPSAPNSSASASGNSDSGRRSNSSVPVPAGTSASNSSGSAGRSGNLIAAVVPTPNNLGERFQTRQNIQVLPRPSARSNRLAQPPARNSRRRIGLRQQVAPHTNSRLPKRASEFRHVTLLTDFGSAQDLE